ncbi:N-acetylmuramoyl-L-alanine amidase [Streptomyces sp. S4.7]|uniref:peptidoglycan recognition protein family protein n=1 Tax=Streptomyces sp. S4.7 TaxID=2705439 RepID=UPI0013976DD0|nr:peptidoglycan recognition protein [Streptomyces sp. S4.7]QHY95874.1 N-acetylmuramoyl-L-alanine amidase [Streptomyces sp. S4.7]
MRVFLSSSIGVACAAALVLPLSLPSGAVAAPQDTGAGTSVPGSTESLPLVPLGSERSSGVATEQGLPQRDVQPFSLVGVVWDDADAELHGSVQVRNRSAGTGAWSGWQDLETHNAEHGADLGTSERDSGTVRGSTAPLWVGASDGVEARVRADEDPDGGPARASLPSGLSLELVDPGEAPEQLPVTEADASRGQAIAADPDPAGTDQDAEDGAAPETGDSVATDPDDGTVTETDDGTVADTGVAARPHTAPRPRIISRKGWGANEKLREKQFGYTKTVKAAFVHHSATGNNYTCKQAPSVIRGIYRYHVTSSGWRDIGYNFAVDKCGNIYEGRAGGVTKPVMGAHTLGFNTNTTGIAVLGSYSSTSPPAAVTTAVAKLSAWKLGLHGINPRGKVTLTSGGSNKYKKGQKVAMNAVSGHRDGFVTDCPGNKLYSKLGSVRVSAAKYQGRS